MAKLCEQWVATVPQAPGVDVCPQHRVGNSAALVPYSDDMEVLGGSEQEGAAGVSQVKAHGHCSRRAFPPVREMAREMAAPRFRVPRPSLLHRRDPARAPECPPTSHVALQGLTSSAGLPAFLGGGCLGERRRFTSSRFSVRAAISLLSHHVLEVGRPS